MQIFGFPGSPFVRKVLVVAAEKGIAVEVVMANPREPSPEFLAASPFRKMPALRDGDYTLADSTAIATYLDALQPSPPLFPAEPRARGKAVWFEEVADTIMSPIGAKIVYNRFVAPRMLGIAGDEEAALQGERELEPIFAYLEAAAASEGWLAGTHYSLGDIAVASCLVTLASVDRGAAAERHPRLTAWLARVRARRAWQDVAGREREAMAARAPL
jgi:glutathione S-transferase